ncbi:MAG: FAD-dependent oxidoreductase, partial [Ignavibacteriales bacterium]|nr:FAD-dependent oxidoreductase [Ignavibacteriales bacterium]
MSLSEKYDVVIIGGGIIGTSIAMHLLRKKNLSLLLIESEDHLAAHQTGNNSGVIHSGLYYKPQSLKAINCAKGREQLYAFCEKHTIPYDKCGKIVIATSADEIPKLNELENRGLANGLKGIKRLKPGVIKEFEPYAAGIDGLFVPQTGIVDYVKVTETYARIAEECGAEIIKNCKFITLADKREMIVHTNRGEF